MLKRWIYLRRLKSAKKTALKLSAESRGKRYRIIQFDGRPQIFDQTRLDQFVRHGIFKKLNHVELDRITLFITPNLNKNVYYKRGF